MFDLNDDNLTRVDRKSTPVDRLPEVAAPQPPARPRNNLDSDEMRTLHGRLMSYYRQELDRQSENRFQMAVDEDYYDNIQWSEEEAQKLQDRGQAPIVYNVIATSINWIIGSEKRGRTDFKILPREEEDAPAAELKTKLLKYLSDVNKLPFARSRAFEDAIKVGIGWMEDGAQDEDDGEPIYSRYESWRNILHDSSSTELDMSDARYIFRTKWVDVDVAKALFPGREAQIQDAVIDPSLYGSFDLTDGDVPMDFAEFDRSSYSVARSFIGYKRERVRLIECEYRVPERVQRLRGGPLNGEVLDKNDPRHLEAIAGGASRVVSKVMMRVRIAHMTVKDMLWEGPSPYKHNRFRFTPIWCYRRGRDNLPYGVIRSVRDIQDDVNKRASKALHILSSNKVIMDEGALPEGLSLEEFTEEVSRPDAVIVKRKGYEMTLNAERDLAVPHLDLMSRGIQMIQQVGGVTDENLGRQTNASSGVAIARRQDQGSLATNKPFDNLRLAAQLQGELQLSLIEQFVSDKKVIRITNERGNPEYTVMNDGLPENDITRTKADFIISEQEWRNTIRQASAEMLMEMIGKMPPDVGIMLLDLAVEAMDLPNRDEIAKRIRGVNGMKDPDQTEPTPEDIAKMEAQAKQQQAAEAMFGADLADKQAGAMLKQAQALKTMAEAERAEVGTMGDRVNATSAAMTSAQMVIAMPMIAQVADGILQEAGWKDAKRPAAAGLPPLPGMPPQPPALPAPPTPEMQAPPPEMAPPMAEQPPIQPQPEPMPEPMPPMQRPPLAMPPIERMNERPPIGMGPAGDAQAVQASVEAVKQISEGTMTALSEISQAIATMATAVKALEKPRTSKVVIEKQADGSFVGKKVEE